MLGRRREELGGVLRRQGENQDEYAMLKKVSVGIFKDPYNQDADNCYQHWSEEKHGLQSGPEGNGHRARIESCHPLQ
ncbi:hypothetical protein H671_2g4755 [Cricetulus griseus]|nr:hypothetical protein H671_2g4755 [Cricetulus griseus]